MKRYKKCIYHGQTCEIRSENADGTVTLISMNDSFERSDGGWRRVDKFESEKIVRRDEVTFLAESET